MKLKTVLNGHVLLRPRAKEAVAGIEIPDTVDKERPTIGEVILGNPVKAWEQPPRVDVGPNGLFILNPGDIVLFNAFAPRKFIHDGEECLLVNGEDIYGVIEE
jgi:co-chaperonin GroES (HSP10)